MADYLSNNVCGRPLRMVLIDSGYRPGKKVELPLNRVMEFCHRFRSLARHCKGSSTPMMGIPIKALQSQVTNRGQALKYNVEGLRVDTDHFKRWVHERLAWPMYNEAGATALGAWYLPRDIDDGYLKQIVSESREVLPSGKAVWIEHSRENHFLDLESMQAAAAHLLNMSRMAPEAGKRAVETVIIRANQPPPSQPSPRGGSIASRLAR